MNLVSRCVFPSMDLVFFWYISVLGIELPILSPYAGSSLHTVEQHTRQGKKQTNIAPINYLLINFLLLEYII
jgi:hypothetical protein